MNRSKHKSIERVLNSTGGWVLVYLDKDVDELRIMSNINSLTYKKHTHVCLKSMVPSLAPLVRKVNTEEKDALRQRLAQATDISVSSGRSSDGGEVERDFQSESFSRRPFIE